MPMTQDSEATGRAYAQLVTGIISELGQGQDVVFLCEGDPLLYGSFAHLLPRLGNRFECEVIPGITSISAAAAAAQIPLGLYDEPIALIPATVGAERLAAILQQCDRVVVMKVGRHLDKVREALAAARMSEDAVLVENATLQGQRVRPLSVVTEPQAPYFSLIIAGRKRAPRMSSGPAIVTLGPRSAALAARLRDAACPAAEIHAPACADCAADVRFAKAAAHIAELFAAGRPIVGLCASGILIRAVATASGRQAQRAAGGRRGRGRLGGGAAAGRPPRRQRAGPRDRGRARASRPPSPPPATSASASRWTRRRRAGPWPTPSTPRPFMAGLLEGAPSRLTVEAATPTGCARLRCPWPMTPRSSCWSPTATLGGRSDRLVYHPPVLALGVGAEAGAPAGGAAGAGRHLPGRARSRPRQPSPASSRSTSRPPSPPSMRWQPTWASRRGSSPATRLLEETPRLANPLGDRVPRDRLLGRGRRCGPGGGWRRRPAAGAQAQGRARHLRRGPRRRATSTRRDRPAAGPARGRRPRSRRPGLAHRRGAAAARRSRGAGRLRPLSRPDRRRRSSASRATSSRSGPRSSAAASRWSAPPRAVRWPWSARAIPASTRWRRWSSSCWSMAPDPAWARVAVTVSPGVSALQAAAAAAGAPLGHDFCAISLSDLLTPVEVIERRVRAAAAGDFVDRLLQPGLAAPPRAARPRARHPAGAPARRPRRSCSARNLGRPDARPRLMPLGELTADQCDMLTLVLVGSSATRRVAAPARPGLGLHATRLPASHDRPFHRRRAGRARPDHRARPAADPALPGLPLRRLAGARPRSWPRRRLAPASSTPPPCISTRSWPRSRPRTRPRQGRGPRPFRRPVALRRDLRADPAAGRAGHRLDDHARRAGLRRRRGGTGRRADPARHRPVGRGHPHRRARLGHAAGREPRRVRRAPAPPCASTSRSTTWHAIVRELTPILGDGHARWRWSTAPPGPTS